MTYQTHAASHDEEMEWLAHLPTHWKKTRLSELIDQLNERFGTDFKQADQLFFDQIQEEAIESETLRQAAASNSKEDFRYVFQKAFEGLVIDRMDGNEEIFGKLMNDGEFRHLAVEHLLNRVYKAFRKIESQPAAQPGETV